MSAPLLQALHAPQPGRTTQQPSARPVRAAPRTAPSRGPRPMTGVLVTVAVILAVLGIQLALSIQISSGAYEARSLQTEERDLKRVERVLTQHMDKLSSPQHLAEQAAQLGMVENLHPASLRLSDAAVLGSLELSTSAVRENNVPNAALSTIAPIDAAGLQPAEETPAAEALKPVRWKGKLPAPVTH